MTLRGTLGPHLNQQTFLLAGGVMVEPVNDWVAHARIQQLKMS
jgi:hypothetical protein